jgi:hypothetical protein
MTDNSKTITDRIKAQLRCDFVIGRIDCNKIPWSDSDVASYITNINNKINDRTKEIVNDLGDDCPTTIPNNGIREYLYEYCDPYYCINTEIDLSDEEIEKYPIRDNPYI